MKDQIEFHFAITETPFTIATGECIGVALW